MNDSQFHQLIDNLLDNIEQQIETLMQDSDVDVDADLNSGVLTLTFENKSKIVINRQEPLHQLWLATRRQGFHFDYQDGLWICNRSGGEFYQLLNQACCEQAQTEIQIKP